MRRKSKFITNGTALGVVSATAFDIFMQWLEHSQANRSFTWDSYDGVRTAKTAMVGGIVGGCIGYGAYLYKVNDESSLPFNSDAFLKDVLNEENFSKNPQSLQNAKEIRNEIKEMLWSKFKSKLVNYPEDTGSLHKRTALSSKFDIDIILPFKKSSFKTLRLMYNTVLDELSREYDFRGEVIENSKTIGLNVNYKGEKISIDIVPGRESAIYKDDSTLYLYSKNGWFGQKDGRFKTNSSIQRRITTNHPKAREVIRLLKRYSQIVNIDIKPVILEQYTVAALYQRNYGLSSSKTENFLNTMKYISNKITNGSLIDLANSNNNLFDKIDSYSRYSFSNQIQKDIIRIESNPEFIKEVLLRC